MVVTRIDPWAPRPPMTPLSRGIIVAKRRLCGDSSRAGYRDKTTQERRECIDGWLGRWCALVEGSRGSKVTGGYTQ